MSLDSLGDYITEARVILQDERTPYRYGDDQITRAVQIGLNEALRIRFDLFLPDGTVVFPANPGDTVFFDPMYRSALLSFVVGHIGIRDAEASQDQRAMSIGAAFAAALTGAGMKG